MFSHDEAQRSGHFSGFVLTGFHNMGPKSETFNFEDVKPILNSIVVSSLIKIHVIRMLSLSRGHLDTVNTNRYAKNKFWQSDLRFHCLCGPISLKS